MATVRNLKRHATKNQQLRRLIPTSTTNAAIAGRRQFDQSRIDIEHAASVFNTFIMTARRKITLDDIANEATFKAWLIKNYGGTRRFRQLWGAKELAEKAHTFYPLTHQQTRAQQQNFRLETEIEINQSIPYLNEFLTSLYQHIQSTGSNIDYSLTDRNLLQHTLQDVIKKNLPPQTPGSPKESVKETPTQEEEKEIEREKQNTTTAATEIIAQTISSNPAAMISSTPAEESRENGKQEEVSGQKKEQLPPEVIPQIADNQIVIPPSVQASPLSASQEGVTPMTTPEKGTTSRSSVEATTLATAIPDVLPAAGQRTFQSSQTYPKAPVLIEHKSNLQVEATVPHSIPRGSNTRPEPIMSSVLQPPIIVMHGNPTHSASPSNLMTHPLSEAPRSLTPHMNTGMRVYGHAASSTSPDTEKTHEAFYIDHLMQKFQPQTRQVIERTIHHAKQQAGEASPSDHTLEETLTLQQQIIVNELLREISQTKNSSIKSELQHYVTALEATKIPQYVLQSENAPKQEATGETLAGQFSLEEPPSPLSQPETKKSEEKTIEKQTILRFFPRQDTLTLKDTHVHVAIIQLKSGTNSITQIHLAIHFNAQYLVPNAIAILHSSVSKARLAENSEWQSVQQTKQFVISNQEWEEIHKKSLLEIVLQLTSLVTLNQYIDLLGVQYEPNHQVFQTLTNEVTTELFFLLPQTDVKTEKDSVLQRVEVESITLKPSTTTQSIPGQKMSVDAYTGSDANVIPGVHIASAVPPEEINPISSTRQIPQLTENNNPLTSETQNLKPPSQYLSPPSNDTQREISNLNITPSGVILPPLSSLNLSPQINGVQPSSAQSPISPAIKQLTPAFPGGNYQTAPPPRNRRRSQDIPPEYSLRQLPNASRTPLDNDFASSDSNNGDSGITQEDEEKEQKKDNGFGFLSLFQRIPIFGWVLIAVGCFIVFMTVFDLGNANAGPSITNPIASGLPPQNVTLTKSVDKATIHPGDVVNYTIRVDVGSSPEKEIVVKDPLTFQPTKDGTPSNISDNGAYDPSTNTVTWNLTDAKYVVSGSSTNLTFSVKPNVSSNTTIYNLATADVTDQAGNTNPAGENTPPNQNTCSGKYTLRSPPFEPLDPDTPNPYGNYGDPNCDFTIDGFEHLIIASAPDSGTALRFMRIAQKESSYKEGGEGVNIWAPYSTSSCGAYGAFQMDPDRNLPYTNPYTHQPCQGSANTYDIGAVDWRHQVSNAINSQTWAKQNNTDIWGLWGDECTGSC